MPISLRNLHQHSIFIPPSTSGPSTPKREDDGWEILSAPSRNGSDSGTIDDEEPLVGHRKSKLAVRDRDVLVTLDNELRMTSLSAPLEERDGKYGSYTVSWLPIFLGESSTRRSSSPLRWILRSSRSSPTLPGDLWRLWGREKSLS